MVGQIIFAGWGWIIAVAVVTLVIPGVVLAVSMRRGKIALTRGDVVLLLSGVLFLAGTWGFLTWAMRAPRTHVLEDDRRVCSEAFAKYGPVEFQGYEEQACTRAGVDLEEAIRCATAGITCRD